MSSEKLMSNPYAWLFLAFCTVAAFIFGIYSWFAGKRRREISYVSSSYRIVQKGKEKIPDLTLLYEKEEIEELTISNYAIWNSGNEVIEEGDIVASKPLRIYSDKESTKILDVTVLSESDETNGFAIENIKDNSAELRFDYINPFEGVVIQVMHTGTKTGLRIEGKIKGGSELRTLSKGKKAGKLTNEQRKRISVFLMMIESVLMTVGSLMLVMIEWGMIPEEFENRLMKMDTSITAKVLAIITFMMAVYLVVSCGKKIRQVYHFDVPAKLRGGLNIDE